jgi:Uma2 family endonuclease
LTLAHGAERAGHYTVRYDLWEEARVSRPPISPFLTESEAPSRKLFTTEEVDRLMETGVFAGQRFELIDGELLDKMGQSPLHASTIQLVFGWLVEVFGPGLVRVQMPIEADGEDRERSQPEPDLAVLRELKPDFDARHPRGHELLLAVEVSDTTVGFDMSRKAVLYSRAGVPEYWVLDLVRRRLVVYREPGDADYRQAQVLAEGDAVTIAGRTEAVKIADLLPPA